MRYVSPGRDEKQSIRLHDAYQRISGWTKPLILGLGALLTLIVTVLSVPPTTVDLSEIRSNLPVTVDASWAIGLVALAQQGLVSGRDFYFNYGPLAQGVAWLSAHMNIYGSVLDALPLILLGFFLLNTLLFTLILVLIPQVSGRHSLIIYLVLHLLNSVFALDMTFRPFMVLLFSIVMAYAMRQSTRARSLGLAGLAGIVSLMAQLLTVELGVISIAVSVAVLGFYTLLSLQPSLLGKPDLHSPHRYALILATILAVFVAGNLILGLSFKLTASQAIGWFDYQRAMLDIMRGYNYTMGTIWAFSSFESRGAAVLISAISVYILLGLRRMQTADGYLLVSLLAASLLLLKGAIVRSDPHHIMLGLTGFALLFLLLWHNWAGLARGRWIHLAVWVGLLGLLLRIWPTAGWASLSRLGSVLKGQVTPIAQYQRLTTAYTPTHLLMPAGLVTSNEPGPVLNFPYENYIGIAAGRPLIAPVLQSYAAHTEALQRYYIQSLERAPRPLDVTYSLDGIVVAAVDGVQQVTRVPIIFEYLYRHFELASTHSFGGIYRLRRRDHPAEMLSTPVAYKVQHTSGPQLRLATALPTQCSLVRLHVKLNYPVTSSLGRPNGVEVAFLYQGIPIHRSNLVAIEAGHTFVTYISLIDAHRFAAIFGTTGAPIKTWDMLQIEARRTGLFQVSPSQVEISEVECITIPATAATKSSDDPPLVDATTPPIYQGGLNFVDCQTGVTGWVWDVNRQDSAVTVAVYDGETVVATGLANQFREDLPLAGKGHGRYAFQIPLPPHLRDGQPHPIRVAIADSQLYFNQQPVLVNCSP